MNWKDTRKIAKEVARDVFSSRQAALWLLFILLGAAVLGLIQAGARWASSLQP